MPRLGVIDIDVSPHPVKDHGRPLSWIVSMTSHRSRRGDRAPRLWGDSEEHRTKELALHSARALADMVVEDGTADRAVVFADGRDVYVRGAARWRPRRHRGHTR